MALVFSVKLSFNCSTVTLKLSPKFVVIIFGIPPAIFTASGYVVQYGAGIRTSSF